MVLELDTGRCVSEEAEPQKGGGHEVVCQEGCWILKGVDWRRERVPARMLGPEGGGL